MGCLIQKKEEVEENKKQNNYEEVLEDIVDIKAVQVKGNMLFSETEGFLKIIMNSKKNFRVIIL